MLKTVLQTKIVYDSHPTGIVKPDVSANGFPRVALHTHDCRQILDSKVGIQQLREKIPPIVSNPPTSPHFTISSRTYFSLLR
jgi:hypothetical protein